MTEEKRTEKREERERGLYSSFWFFLNNCEEREWNFRPCLKVRRLKKKRGRRESDGLTTTIFFPLYILKLFFIQTKLLNGFNNIKLTCFKNSFIQKLLYFPFFIVEFNVWNNAYTSH